MLFSLLYIFVVRQQRSIAGNRLPLYPAPRLRQSLFLVVGELHNLKKPEPVEHPRWLTIPDRGLYTGIAVFGAIGWGKTSCCMYPFAEQMFAYKAADRERCASALVLEVKGDFCYKVAALLMKLGREADYVEVGLEGRYRYNPLHNDLEAYALAYGIASLLNNLFGKGKEPFWQQGLYEPGPVHHSAPQGELRLRDVVRRPRMRHQSVCHHGLRPRHEPAQIIAFSSTTSPVSPPTLPGLS